MVPLLLRATYPYLANALMAASVLILRTRLPLGNLRLHSKPLARRAAPHRPGLRRQRRDAPEAEGAWGRASRRPAIMMGSSSVMAMVLRSSMTWSRRAAARSNSRACADR